MPISLGSIYIELKANTAQFVDGMTKAAVNSKAFGKDMQTAFAKMGELFAPLGVAGETLAGVFNVLGTSARGAFKEIGESGALLGGLSALTGGTVALGGTMLGLAEKSADVGARIYEASEKTGIAAEQMSGIMALTKETGGSFDALTTSLARAGANLQSAIIEPGSETGKIFASILGGSKQLADEGLKPMGDRIFDVIKHIFALNDVGQRNLALSKLLGKGWMENVESLRLLATQGIRPFEDDAKRFGEFFTDETARQAFQFTAAMKQLTAEISGVGLAIGQWALPFMNNLATVLAGIVPLAESVGLKIAALASALTGFGLHEGIKLWKQSDEKMAESYDLSNKFAIKVADLAKGQEAAADMAKKLADAFKGQSDALADLGTRLQEQLAMLNAHGNKTAEAFAEYGKMTDAIQKAAATSGTYTEKLNAQNVAFQILLKNLRDAAGMAKVNLMVPKVFGGVTSGGSTRFGAMQDLPLFAAGVDYRGIGAPAGLQTQFMSAAAPNIQGFGALASGFRELTGPLQTQGQDLGDAMAKAITSSVDQIEDKFAEMVVKGKANFRDLAQSIEEMFLKAGMQKLVSEMFSMGQSGLNSAGGGGGLGALAGIGGLISKTFGGFLAGGGDVTPDLTYIVGEKGAEFFTPTVPGTVHKSVPVGGNNTVINFHVHGVQDADSFRRSTGQIMGDLHRAMTIAAARRG